MAKWWEQSFEDNGENEYYKIAKAYANYNATITCTVGWRNGWGMEIFSNIIQGRIVEARDGTGWGFFKNFVPEGSKKTYSQMSHDEQLKFSARGKCFVELKEFLKKI
jgi:inosine/xanthosine triphosphate pyrophosphatase family protein